MDSYSTIKYGVISYSKEKSNLKNALFVPFLLKSITTGFVIQEVVAVVCLLKNKIVLWN